MNKLSVEVQLNEEDIYQFRKYNLLKKFPLKWVGMGYLIFMVICAMTAWQRTEAGDHPIFPFVMMIVVTYSLATMLPSIRKSIRKMFKDNKNLQEKQTYELSEDSFAFTNTHSNAYYKWTECERAIETEVDFQIRTAKQVAYILPKRCLSDQEVVWVREWITGAPTPISEPSVLAKPIRNFLIFVAIALVIVVLLKGLAIG